MMPWAMLEKARLEQCLQVRCAGSRDGASDRRAKASAGAGNDGDLAGQVDPIGIFQ
jgi:hypothetical protein